ncbi:MAG TPA: DUF2252 domain-containing protein [Acidimicrobiales bacterium]|nr:DUF2252 domain-containing protein [Acidimicrobiales bacterium]
MTTQLSAADQVAQGRAARARVRRRDHAIFEPAPDRPNPIDLLEQQAETRVPELVPIRYGRMLVSPFAFFRGAALVMAQDLATTPASGLNVQACGDAHMSNFGVFASPERHLIFDVNDFDETLPGPWEWDVKRLAASLAIAGRDRGFSPAERRTAVTAAAEMYRSAMRGFASMGTMDVWYAHLDVDDVMARFGSQLTASGRKRTQEELTKARTRDSLQAFNKLTAVVDGRRRIISDPPLIVPVEELLSEGDATEFMANIRGLLRAYRRTLSSERRVLLDRFQLVQMARKVVGVGSVGTRAWILLMEGRDNGEPLFLQAKEAQSSVLEGLVGKSEFGNCGQRVVVGQRLMQAVSDVFLGWDRVLGLDAQVRDFYVRQLRDWKGSADVTIMQPAGMAAYARLCGWTLARGHARSGNRQAIAAYLGAGPAFDDAIAVFAETYADQNERDYEQLRQAVADGKITAQTGL